MECLGDSLQPPASREVTIHSPKEHHKVLSPLLWELLALGWERRRLLVSTQGSPFAQRLSALCTRL